MDWNSLDYQLVLAIENDDLDTVKSLLDAGADPGRYREGDEVASLPLASAIEFENHEAIRLLLAAGATPCAFVPDSDPKISLLEKAFDSGDLLAIELLLDANADPWFLEDYGDPTVVSAAGNRAVLELLHRRGVELLQTFGAENTTLLHWACKLGTLEAASFLVTIGADPFRQDASGKAALDLAENTEMKSHIMVLQQAKIAREEIDGIAIQNPHLRYP